MEPKLQISVLLSSNQVSFCELVLPFLIHDILSNGTACHKKILSNQISRFFAEHCGQYSRMSVSRATTPSSQQGKFDKQFYTQNQKNQDKSKTTYGTHNIRVNFVKFVSKINIASMERQTAKADPLTSITMDANQR